MPHPIQKMETYYLHLMKVNPLMQKQSHQINISQNHLQDIPKQALLKNLKSLELAALLLMHQLFLYYRKEIMWS